MTTQLPLTDSKANSGLKLFSASSVKFWGLSGAALAGLMLFPHNGGGELMTGLSVVGMGAFLFWNRLNPKQLAVRARPEKISESHFNQLCTEIESVFEQIQAESGEIVENGLDALKESLASIRENCDRTQVRIAITGDVGVGKTALLKQLDLTDTITEALWSGEAEIPEAVTAADLTLFVAQGDLTQSELQRIQALQSAHKPCLIVLNKVDQFRSTQLEALVQKRTQVLKGIEVTDQLAIAAHPQTILVRRHLEDGSFVEVEEQPAAQLTELTQRLEQRLSTEGRRELVLQQAYNQAEDLRHTSIQTLNQLRRTRALPVVEKYQWLSASAAFASPLPSTDMIATAAITGKLITDLGELYQHQFSVSEAQNIAAILAKAFLKLGLVELSSQLLGGVLKSHAATYVAGGFIQGLSVAYLTHIAGLSLIEHFETMALAGEAESSFSLDKVTHIVEKVFAQNQRIDFLKGLVGQGINRLQPAQ